jgi:hypothetical protein
MLGVSFRGKIYTLWKKYISNDTRKRIYRRRLAVDFIAFIYLFVTLNPILLKFAIVHWKISGAVAAYVVVIGGLVVLGFVNVMTFKEFKELR